MERKKKNADFRPGRTCPPAASHQTGSRKPLVLWPDLPPAPATLSHVNGCPTAPGHCCRCLQVGVPQDGRAGTTPWRGRLSPPSRPLMWEAARPRLGFRRTSTCRTGACLGACPGRWHRAECQPGWRWLSQRWGTRPGADPRGAHCGRAGAPPEVPTLGCTRLGGATPSPGWPPTR